jgi:hypothetical protein
MTEEAGHYESLDEMERVVRGFESCRLSPEEFTHRAHLTVALCYLRRLTVPLAAERMRASLLRFLDHHNVAREKYNETITLFWIKLLRKLLDDSVRKRPFVPAANEVIAQLNDSRLIFDYYSRERLFSEEARSGWVEPDLKSEI